jgi:hypothetical protein
VSPFGNGTPKHDRRKPGDHPLVGGDREDDPDTLIARGMVRWWKWLATKRMVWALVTAASGSAVTWIGISLVLARRVDALEGGFAVVQTEVREVRGDMNELMELRERDARSDTANLYMTCRMFERAFPNAIGPRECDNVNPRR